MSQIAEDYQQVSSGFGLSPSFVNSTSAPLEDRSGAEHFLDLFRRDGVLSNMVNAFKRPLKIVDFHGQSQTINIHEIEEFRVYRSQHESSTPCPSIPFCRRPI